MNISSLLSFYGHCQPLEALLWFFNRRQLSIPYKVWNFHCFTNFSKFIFRPSLWITSQTQSRFWICWPQLRKCSGRSQFVHFFVNSAKWWPVNSILMMMKSTAAAGIYYRLKCRKCFWYSNRTRNTRKSLEASGISDVQEKFSKM